MKKLMLILLTAVLLVAVAATAIRNEDVLIVNTLTVRGTITGEGSGLTSLNADQLTSGTVADARIASTLARDAEVAAAYQPLDADLTTYAGITPTSFGQAALASVGNVLTNGDTRGVSLSNSLAVAGVYSNMSATFDLKNHLNQTMLRVDGGGSATFGVAVYGGNGAGQAANPKSGFAADANGVRFVQGNSTTIYTNATGRDLIATNTVIATNGFITISNTWPIDKIGGWTKLGNCGCVEWMSNNVLYKICTNSLSGVGSTNLILVVP